MDIRKCTMMYDYFNTHKHVTANNTKHKKTHFTITEDRTLYNQFKIDSLMLF